MILKILRNSLQSIIEDIDSGNSNASEEELNEIVDTLNRITRKDVTMTKYTACKYINLSRAQFDNYVREGLIPKGKHEQGGTLRWDKKDLDNSIKLIRRNKNGKKNY